jgi:hypothetical protein
MQGIAVIGIEKYKNFLGDNTPDPPLLLNAIPHQLFITNNPSIISPQSV